jgi:hypothetical protein
MHNVLSYIFMLCYNTEYFYIFQLIWDYVREQVTDSTAESQFYAIQNTQC